jgi:hypothetical protein
MILVPEKVLRRHFDLVKGEPEAGRVRIWLLRDGSLIIDFVIQIETTIDGKIYTVRRYDCAHGQPHCDIYDRRGNHYKVWLTATTRKAAWDAAMLEVKLHGRDWVQQFLGLFGQE